MAHSYVISLHHCVFSTKDRCALLRPHIRGPLFAYVNGIAANIDLDVLALNGVDDHIHMLVGLHKTQCIAKAMQQLKANSSRWLKQNDRDLRAFQWQEGYGAFSIGVAQVEVTKRYIANQEQRHRKLSFEEEYEGFLTKHGIRWVPDEALG